MKLKTVSVVGSLLLLNACASVAERNPNDPYERYNRSMFNFNEKADHYVMKPVARGYQKITPQVVQKGVSNFFDNLRDVVSLGSNVLRGDLNKAGTDLVRVTVNSTVGLGGLINIADKEGIPNNKNTLGDTFASWGWKKSNYLVFPLTGPSTVRDSVGSAIVSVYPIEKAIIHDKIARYALTGVKAVDTRVKYLPLTDMLEKTDTMDKYAYMRDMYMTARNKQIGVATEEIDIDELIDPEMPAPEAKTTIRPANGGAPNVAPQRGAGSKAKRVAKMKQHHQPDVLPVSSWEREELTTDLSPMSRQIWQYGTF